MLKRPTSEDTEEDLLQLQQDFFTKQQKPSVILKRPEKQKDVVQLGEAAIKKPEEEQGIEKRQFRLTDDDFDIARKLDKEDKTHISEVVSEILEKEIFEFKEQKNVYYETGFPVPPKIEPTSSKPQSVKSKKKSRFAQYYEELNKQAACGKALQEQNSDKPDVPGFNEQSRIVTANMEKSDIHEENLKKIEKMSHDEIIEEQQKLLQTLDPSIVSFLRGKNKPKTEASKTSTIADQKEKVKQPFLDIKENIDPYKEFGIRKDYVNMNKVERDKLAWMTDLPKVQSVRDEVSPRFDFTGNLLSHNDSFPVNMGLHHHGEDPGTPGYTLEELFHMSRSNFQQQRVTALRVLGRIIEQYQQQSYVGQLSADLLKQCLDAGLLFILRWSMDDHAEQIYSASLQCFAYILYVKGEQEIVIKYLHTVNGFFLPRLCQYYKKSKEEMTQEEREEDRDLTDAELVAEDVIKGLIQMQFLPRLRYIMEICKPSESLLVNSLLILIRIVQHDQETAYEVFKCPGLIDVVLQFVGSNIAVDNVVTVHAIKLIVYFCLSGRHMASNLVDRGIDEMISTFYALGKDIYDQRNEAIFHSICILWSILLEYGLCISLVRDLYPLLITHLQDISQKYQHCKDMPLAGILLIINATIGCFKNKDQCDWSIIEGLFTLVQKSLEQVQDDMLTESKITHPYTTSALLRCCSLYYNAKNTKVADVSPVELLEEVNTFWESFLEPIFVSSLFENLLQELSQYTDFKKLKDEDLYMDYPCNLQSYGILNMPSCSPPSMQKDSSIFLIQDLLKLMKGLVVINKNLINKVTPLLISPSILSYFQQVSDSSNRKRCSYLITTSIELTIIEDVLSLFYLKGESTNWSQYSTTLCSIYLNLCCKILPSFHLSQENVVEDILVNIIFNPKMHRTDNYVLWMTSTLEGNVGVAIKKTLTSAKKSLRRIGTMYQTLLFEKRSSKQEKAKETFLTTTRDKTVLPNDWFLYPVIKYYNVSLNIDLTGNSIAQAKERTVENIAKCLQFMLLLEATCSQVLGDISEATRFTRFLCVFLTEGRIYMEESVRCAVQSLSLVYSSPSFQSYLNLEEQIPGVTSFYDIYCSLLDQYLASSFGDHVFGNLLLIPLQLKYDVKYRRAVWTEYCEMLRIFPLPLNQVTCDIKSFTWEGQEDVKMVAIYFQKLKTGQITPNWCPFFYAVAIHHICQFTFNCHQEEHKEQRALYIENCLKLQNKDIRDDIIYYEKIDVNEARGIKRFKQLPPSRELMLRR